MDEEEEEEDGDDDGEKCVVEAKGASVVVDDGYELCQALPRPGCSGPRSRSI